MVALNPNVQGTVAGVQSIIDTDLGTGTIHYYLNMAYYRTGSINLKNCGGTAALGTLQEMLAAHWISIGMERQTMRESIAGEATVQFSGKTDMGLDATLYGQTAKDLDCTGTLAKWGLKSASFRVWSHKDIDYDTDSSSSR
jgi:hypothetical protein